jgi:HAD superfamily hydrolase (TIGR01662 family)
MSGRRFKAVLFDLGSTLIYFDCDPRGIFDRMDAAMFDSLRKSSIEIERDTFLRQFRSRLEAYESERGTEFIEHTTAFILRSLLAEFGVDQLQPGALKAALRAWYAVSQACWKPEEGVESMLKVLRGSGYRLGIISNASDDEDVQTLVDNANLRPHFDLIVTSAAQGIRKPNPRIFLNALSKLGVEPDQAAMVGDTLGADILGAHNAGVFAIWSKRRADKAANHDHLDTIQPDAVIASLAELPSLLGKLETEQPV